MEFQGHVDFYGRHGRARGWFFCGWSNPWPECEQPLRVTAHFFEGSIVGGQHVAFYRRDGLGDRGFGFILFIHDDPPQNLNTFGFLEIGAGDISAEIAPNPPPRHLIGGELLVHLGRLLQDEATPPMLNLRAIAFPLGHNHPEGSGTISTNRPNSGYFDELHMEAGAEAIDMDTGLPVGAFSHEFYLTEYADVRDAGLDPLVHFIDSGLKEGRQPSLAFNTWLVRAVLEKRLRRALGYDEAAWTFVALPRDAKFIPNDWFNGTLFRQRYGNDIADVQRRTDYELFLLYLCESGRRGWSPNGFFDEAAYQAAHPDVKIAIDSGRVSGFDHFLNLGWREGRSVPPLLADAQEGARDKLTRDFFAAPRDVVPSFLAWFDETFYRMTNSDVQVLARRDAFKSGLEHFLVEGFAEGRVPHPGLVPAFAGGRAPRTVNECAAALGNCERALGLDDAAWLRRYLLEHQWHSVPAELDRVLWEFVLPPPISGSFDRAAYLAANPDLGDLAEAQSHWKLHGLREQRISPQSNVFADRVRDIATVFDKPGGINYIGPLSLTTGMGVAARGNVEALRSAGLKVAEYDVSGIIHEGKPIDLFSGASLVYSHNLIHLNPDQILPFIARFGTAVMDDRINIGYWAWELPAPRAEWRSILSGFDLILVPSEYNRTAFESFTNTLVLPLPHVVDEEGLRVAASAAKSNDILTLIKREKDKGKKIILSVMDSSSYERRKGADVFVALFLEISRTEPGQHLFCIKTHSRNGTALTGLGPSYGSDLIVIDDVWDWPELCQLRSLADLYVSPHRSEGFGLNVFESIIMGVPTLVSRCGGVLDVLEKDYSLYIDGRWAEVGEDIGPYRKHSIWFEPDIQSLVAKFSYALSPAFKRNAWRKAVKRVSSALSKKSVGRHFAEILQHYCGLGLDLSGLKQTLSSSRQQCFRLNATQQRPGQARSDNLPARIAGALTPFFSVITPTYNTKPEWLQELYDDLLAQDFPSWEWCIYDDGSTETKTLATMKKLKEADARVLVRFGAKNVGIAAATNNAVSLSTGMFVLFVDHDDRLSDQLLSSYRSAIDSDSQAGILYCDEDKLLPDGSLGDHFYKPDWSPEHLISTMYILHCLCVKKELFLRLGGYRDAASGAQDHDFALRASAAGAKFHHVNRILYHWRMTPYSTATDAEAKPYADTAGLLAVRNYLTAIGLPGTAEPGLLRGTYRIRPAVTDPKVTLAILTAPAYGDFEGQKKLYVEQFVGSLLRFESKLDIEIRVIVNEGNEPMVGHMADWDPRVKVEACSGTVQDFNFAKKANWAVRSSRTERVVLLNDDMEAVDADWIEAMMEMLELPGVGIVGARLLYGDGCVQHTGLALGVNGASTHLFAGAPRDYVGYNAFTHVIRNYSAVTGACMAFTRRVFERLGGLDEQFPHDFNDTDFCLKAIRAGLRVVYTPFATLRHFESRSLHRLAADPVDREAFYRRWRAWIDNDPYYNINLTRSGVYCEAR